MPLPRLCYIYWLIHFNVTHLYDQDCFYFFVNFFVNSKSFCKEFLILIEANCSHLLHCPFFFITLLKKMRFSKVSTYTQSFHYNINLNQSWRKINIPPCRARIGLSLMWKWKFHNLSIKSSKLLIAN